MSKNLIELARENNFSPAQVTEEIDNCYAALASMKLEEAQADKLEHTVTIKNEEIHIVVTRKIINE